MTGLSSRRRRRATGATATVAQPRAQTTPRPESQPRAPRFAPAPASIPDPRRRTVPEGRAAKTAGPVRAAATHDSHTGATGSPAWLFVTKTSSGRSRPQLGEPLGLLAGRRVASSPRATI